MSVYRFPNMARFHDRDEERQALEAWYDDKREWRAMALHGRRRVGKSWLFRAFAHGREADIFVADTRALADQLAGFAASLERDNERPDIPDLETFFRILYRRAANERRLAIIDELPYLWKVEKELPSILLRVMEEEAASSQLKLVLTGSHVGMMERLLTEREPLHDRLRPLRIRPLDFWRARQLLGEGTAEQLLTAYGLAGGMPRYLTELAGVADPAARMADLTLDPYGALFNEPRAILAQELEAPHVYFSLLAALAAGPQPWPDIVSRSRVDHDKMGRYLSTLQDLGIVIARSPITDPSQTTRARLYTISDGFLRFWFRFVFPYQADLESGLNRRALYETDILPHLANHLAPIIEEIARDWVRREGLAGVNRVGAWWGPSLDEFRQAGTRTSEEIDIVGIRGGRAVLIGEVRWQSDPMSVGMLGELDRFKIPALARAIKIAAKPTLVLVSKSGFTPGLREAAAKNDHLQLVDLERIVAG
jgi:hypothetical protein